MLKFFRRIRRNLIDEGNLKRYLLYTAGEILLVMTGILLALQVNKWNNDTERRKLEKSTLIELNESLDTDILMLQNQIKTQTYYINQIENLLQELKSNEEPTEAIDSLLIFPVRENIISLNSSAFELLESRGIDLITNQTLRKEIVKHFKYDQQKMVDRSKVWADILMEFGPWYDALLDPIIDKNELSNYTIGSEKFKALDYPDFRSNPLILSKIKYRIHRKVREIELIKELIKQKEMLRSLISKEI